MVEKEVSIRIHTRYNKKYQDLKAATDNDTLTLSEYITDGIELLRSMPSCGKNIPKKQCAHILKKHGINNLWVLKLKNGWRILYSLAGDGKKCIVVIIVFFGDHKEYERYLNY